MLKVRSLFSIAALAIAVSFMTGCVGEKVEVPPANVGKIMTKNGYQEDFKQTSKFRLEWCWFYCDKLVLLDVSDFAKTESFTLFMPEDRLNMEFDVRLTLTVDPDKRDMLFNKISPSPTKGTDTMEINIARAYQVYAQQIIRAEAREFMADYSILEISSNRDVVGSKLADHLQKTINGKTPFIVRYAGLADVQYPPIIVEAQENAAKRREMIQQERAQLEVSKVSMERELQEATMQRKIEVEKARTDAERNKILADSMTPAYARYQQLEALRDIATSENTKFVPIEMLGTMAGQVMLGAEGNK